MPEEGLVTCRRSGANQKSMELVPSADFWREAHFGKTKRQAETEAGVAGSGFANWTCRCLGRCVAGCSQGSWSRRTPAMRPCFLPNEGKEGVNAGRGESTSVLTTRLKDLLISIGVEKNEVFQYSCHSAKATLLSWCAKAGMKMEDGRLLSGHVKLGQRVPLEYSRDVLAGPIRRLETLIKQVRSGVFKLDASSVRALA